MVTLKPERLDAGEFDEQPLSICGKSFIADHSGALYWPAEDALIISDLAVARGVGRDTSQILLKLAQVIDKFAAQTVICLGSPGASPSSGLEPSELDTLRMLQDEREWIWLMDDARPELADALRGHIRSELQVAGINLRHRPRLAPVTHEIAGHFNPAARISLNGHIIRRPCFAGNGRRLVLPVFGSHAGGLNVLDVAFASLFDNGGQSVWMLGQEGLYPVASRLLRED